jgi:hypothetical protein
MGDRADTAHVRGDAIIVRVREPSGHLPPQPPAESARS